MQQTILHFYFRGRSNAPFLATCHVLEGIESSDLMRPTNSPNSMAKSCSDGLSKKD